MKKKVLIAAILAASAATAVQAYQAGDLIVRAGAAIVDPSVSSGYVKTGATNTGGKVDVDRDTQFGLASTYMLNDHLGIGLLLATPFTHTIKATDALSGAGHLAEVKQLPPTLTAQYYFNAPSSALQPYVGAGINYTNFFDTHFTGANASTYSGLSLDNSWGLAGQAGFDYDLGNHWNLNAEISYVDISTTAKFKDNSGNRYKVNLDLDPWVYMLGVGYTF